MQHDPDHCFLSRTSLEWTAIRSRLLLGIDSPSCTVWLSGTQPDCQTVQIPTYQTQIIFIRILSTGPTRKTPTMQARQAVAMHNEWHDAKLIPVVCIRSLLLLEGHTGLPNTRLRLGLNRRPLNHDGAIVRTSLNALPTNYVRSTSPSIRNH